MDFWISEWISGFQNWISGFQIGFQEFTVDFWISADGVRDFFHDVPLTLLSDCILFLAVCTVSDGKLNRAPVLCRIVDCRLWFVHKIGPSEPP